MLKGWALVFKDWQRSRYELESDTLIIQREMKRTAEDIHTKTQGLQEKAAIERRHA